MKRSGLFMAMLNGKDIQNKLQNGNSSTGSFTAVIQSELKKVFPAIRTIVPKNMTPERLARMALTTISRTPKLIQCSGFHQQTVTKMTKIWRVKSRTLKPSRRKTPFFEVFPPGGSSSSPGPIY